MYRQSRISYDMEIIYASVETLKVTLYGLKRVFCHESLLDLYGSTSNI